MSTFYDGYESSSSNVSRISRISRISGSELNDNVTTPITSTSSNQSSTLVVHKPDKEDEELKKLRRLWWEEGNIHPQAKWEETKLPYIIAEGITLEEYEERTDKFNIRCCWEWVEFKVIIYELPSEHHENFIGSISTAIIMECSPVYETNASIGNQGATRTRADNSQKEADQCFRPTKPLVQSPSGRDGDRAAWPNLVIEVAYSESESHVLKKVKEFWLGNFSRVHDVIVIKIDPVSEKYEPPTRMQAWHFCITDKRFRYRDIEHRTYFEFGTHDKDGNPTNIQPGQCVIKISLDCLYHDYDNTKVDITIPRRLLSDPIVLDFLSIREKFFRMY